jgi:hypothetical protein
MSFTCERSERGGLGGENGAALGGGFLAYPLAPARASRLGLRGADLAPSTHYPTLARASCSQASERL